MRVPVLILESTRCFLKSGRDFTRSFAEKMSRADARNIYPLRRSRERGLERKGRCNNTTSVPR